MPKADGRKMLHPEGWKPASGYANGIVASGPMVFVGGQIGWNAEQVFESDDFVAQTRQALQNVVDGAGRGRRRRRSTSCG